jgi:hypothetical protein
MNDNEEHDRVEEEFFDDCYFLICLVSAMDYYELYISE